MDVIELAGRVLIYGLGKVVVPTDEDGIAKAVAEAVYNMSLSDFDKVLKEMDSVDKDDIENLNLTRASVPLAVYSIVYNQPFGETIKKLVTAEITTAKKMNSETLMDIYYKSMEELNEYNIRVTVYDGFGKNVFVSSAIAQGFANLVKDLIYIVNGIFEEYGEPVIDTPEAVYGIILPKIAKLDTELAAAVWYSGQKKYQKIWWGCLFLKIEAVEWLKVLAEEMG